MVDIVHRVGVRGVRPDQVFQALTTLEGLRGWWASDTTGSSDVGGVIAVRFAPGGFDMEVLESEPARRVLWRVVAGPDEWLDTTVEWVLSEEDDYTIVMFRHLGWREPVAFMHHCSTKWAVFLLSLKSLLETGIGAPDSRDLSISNWH